MKQKRNTFSIVVIAVGLLAMTHFLAKAQEPTPSPGFRRDIPLNINAFVSKIADQAVPFGTAMAAIGVVTMAFIQTIKDMLPVRRWFQRYFVQNWLKRGFSTPEAAFDALMSSERDLIKLTAAGDVDAFYDLATEQLCGQINAAAQILVEYPSRYRSLLDCLAAGADPEDIAKLVSPPDFVSLDRDALSQGQQKEVTAVFDARNRLSHYIQRNIDALQISMGFRWKFLLQIVSFAISFAIAFFGVFQINRPDHLVAGLLVGGMAGFLAPVARDLVAALQQLRKP